MAASRPILLRRSMLLNATGIVWNVVEGIVAVGAGVLASSVALIGFGIDSFIEVTSAVVVFRRVWTEWRGESAMKVEQMEHRAAKIAGALLLLLAAYIVVDAGRRLLGYGEEARESLVGTVMTGLSLIVMPVLGWAELRVADGLKSRALRTDAFQTITCVWLSLTTFIGLVLNAVFGWAWADPAAGLLIVPLLVHEGIEGWKGRGCHSCHDAAPAEPPA